MVRGLGARARTLLPTVRSSGQPVNAREAWSFCPRSGKVFHGPGVAARSGRPVRGRTSAHDDGASRGAAVQPCRWQDGVDSHTEWCHSKES